MRYPRGHTITTLRPSIFKRTTSKGETFYNAVVRGANAQRTYLGTTTDKAQALAICERFIATGEKPPGGKRGPKGRRSGMPAKPRKPKAISANQKAARKHFEVEKYPPKVAGPYLISTRPTPQDTKPTAPKMSHRDKIAMLRGMLARIG